MWRGASKGIQKELGVRLNASRLTVKPMRAPSYSPAAIYLPAAAGRKNLKLQSPPDLKHRPIRNTSKNPWLDIRSGALNTVRTVADLVIDLFAKTDLSC